MHQEATARRISDLIDETGVSRELIHHYLREGLLPKPRRRAEYSEKHAQLLILIKKLRDEHNLPLDVIRQLFELNEYNPQAMLPLTLAEPFAERMRDLLQAQPQTTAEQLTWDELIERTGVGSDRLQEYLDAKLIVPWSENGDEPRFCAFDAQVVALGEHGRELGVPFSTLRSIGRYCRVGFDLEYKAFFPPGTESDIMTHPESIVAQLFLRREIALGFVQNLLQSQFQLSLWRLLQSSGDTTQADDLMIYRPSPAFLRRYGLSAAIEAQRARLSADAGTLNHWERLVRLLIHGGHEREAAFFLEEALQRWPEEPSLLALHWRLSPLMGEDHIPPDAGAPLDDPVALCWRALSRMKALGNEQIKPRDLPARLAAVPLEIEQALNIAATREADRLTALETRLVAGWLLCVLPEAIRNRSRGIELLERALEECVCDTAQTALPAYRIRLCIQGAWWLYRILGESPAPSETEIERRGKLADEICRLDPGCGFAQLVFAQPVRETEA